MLVVDLLDSCVTLPKSLLVAVNTFSGAIDGLTLANCRGHPSCKLRKSLTRADVK